MENSFYLELAEMAQEALDELDRYESTGQSGAVFDKIRAVGVPCLDGKKSANQSKMIYRLEINLNFSEPYFQWQIFRLFQEEEATTKTSDRIYRTY